MPISPPTYETELSISIFSAAQLVTYPLLLANNPPTYFSFAKLVPMICEFLTLQSVIIPKFTPANMPASVAWFTVSVEFRICKFLIIPFSSI